MDVVYNELLNRVITLILSRVSYLGALVYKNNPVIKNSIFGNQTANSGFILPFMANVLDSVENNINKALKAMPIPILIPIPPLILREASDTPINVKIREAKGIEKRL